MKISDYFKSRSGFVIINVIIFILILAVMSFLKVGSGIISLVFLMWFMPVGIFMILEAIKFKKFFNDMQHTMEELDKKYLLSSVIKKPDFIEGKLFYNILKETDRATHEQVKKYEYTEKEYREYIEMWVHEIKTPIASARLIIENNEDVVTNRIGNELNKVEKYIEQVLYYSKSSDVSKDYIIREFSLEGCVMAVIKKNSRDFINKRTALDICDIKETIFSDRKWVEFILNQIVGNAVKYSTEDGGRVKISTEERDNQVILTIEDNGVGISERDLGRVFEKGFTGDNGRLFGKSTGMGLYLCKKLCDRLGIGISINSTSGVGTSVRVVFPQSELYQMNRS